MIQLENELDGERTRFERQLVRILKAAGLYGKAGLGRRRGHGGHGDRALLASRSSDGGDRDRNDGDGGDGDVDFVVELFRQQQDEERLKVMALKSVLLQFSNKLSEEDEDVLMNAGVVLGPPPSHGGGTIPRRAHHTGGTGSSSINFRSALCIAPSY